MQTWKTSLELDENASGTEGLRFNITLYINKLPSGLLQGEVSVALLRNGRTLLNTDQYIITEMTDALIVRRVVERLQRDQAFFTKVNEAIR